MWKGNLLLYVDGGDRVKLPQGQGSQVPLGRCGLGFSDDEESLCVASDVGVGVRRGGNAEGTGLADRLAQKFDQCSLMLAFLMPADG